MKDPVLRGPKVYTEDGATYRIVVHGGLHYIRGNSAPYFSLTYWQDRKERGAWHEDSGGCGHELIISHWPELADLAAMHSSDINGAPMYAEANGWYWLAGALGGAGQDYHGGNSKQNFPLPESKRDPAKPWNTTEHRDPTEDECLAILARHCRITMDDARAIRDACQLAFGPEDESINRPPHSREDYRRGRAVWAEACEGMRTRWKREADECIAKHSLTIYGDEWRAA